MFTCTCSILYYFSHSTLLPILFLLLQTNRSVVFCIYDRWVEQRQKVVMKTAVKTRDIVSNLFPRNIRDRLYNSNESSTNEAVSIANATRPMADTFADCTVAFIGTLHRPCMLSDYFIYPLSYLICCFRRYCRFYELEFCERGKYLKAIYQG